MGWGDGSGGNGSDGEWQMKLCLLPATHLLLHGLVPNRPWTGTGPCPRDWGPCPRLFLSLARTNVLRSGRTNKLALSGNPVFPCPFLLCSGVAVLVKQRGGSCTVGELGVLWVLLDKERLWGTLDGRKGVTMERTELQGRFAPLTPSPEMVE